MNSDLEQLYQQLILDHAKRPRGHGLLGDADGRSHQMNPICGDEVTVELHVGGDALSVRWEGHGCAISQASASLLVGTAEGLTPEELTARIDAFRTVMRSRGALELDEELFGDAVVLGGVSRFSARVKCAMLAWVGAEDALSQFAPETGDTLGS